MNNNNNPYPGQQPPQGQPIDIHAPFTLQEHFAQLASTERDITSILTPLVSSLSALSTPPNPATPNEPQERFKAAQESYFRTIDRISKHLDRQIYALEEANILSLSPSSAAQQQPDDSQPSTQPQSQPGQQTGQNDKDAKNPKSSGVARLDPDGTGKYGKLDVGRLNLASSTTERDVEAETWERVKAHFEQVSEAAGNDRMQE